MPTIAATDVKKLRDATGAGMMDAKKALTEAEGDFDQAVEILRVTGQAKAAKRGAERSASNGLVAAEGGALIQLGAETDFVAKNEQFQNLAYQIASMASARQLDGVEAVRAGELPTGKTVAEAVEALAVVIGEKLELTNAAYFDGQTAVYLHKRASDLPPQVGVIVQYEGEDAAAARSVAMQIAAMKPQYLTRDEVPADVVSKEREIAEATSREEGKPEQAIAKITEGRLNGFFKDVVLLEQPSVTENKKTVKAVLDAAGTTLLRFARFEVGA